MNDEMINDEIMNFATNCDEMLKFCNGFDEIV